MKLGPITTRCVMTVASTDLIDKAISLMEEHDIHHLPVVEHDRVVGMLSDRDLLLAVGGMLRVERTPSPRQERTLGPRTVGEIMSRPVAMLPSDSTVQMAARVMVERGIGSVVLTREGKMVGIATRNGLLARSCEFAESDDRLTVLLDRVEQHMRAHVTSAGPKDSIHAVAETMHRKGFRHVPIVAAGVVLGMISDRDVRRACGRERIEDERAQSSGEMFIGLTMALQVMSKPVRTIQPQATILAATRDMIGHHIGALPVTMGEQLVGIITETDVVRLLSRIDG